MHKFRLLIAALLVASPFDAKLQQEILANCVEDARSSYLQPSASLHYQQFPYLAITLNQAFASVGAPNGVPDYTGTPGSGTDNAPIFQAYLTANCRLDLRAGRYRVASGLTTTCQKVTISGKGDGTEIVFDGPIATGITIDASGSDQEPQVTIRDLKIATTQAHAGTALDIRQYPNISAHRFPRKLVMQNVVISGDDTYTQGWLDGITLRDVEQFSANQIWLTGQSGNP
jgi:hypothetical protein